LIVSDFAYQLTEGLTRLRRGRRETDVTTIARPESARKIARITGDLLVFLIRMLNACRKE
jgi:hypothetical protein